MDQRQQLKEARRMELEQLGPQSLLLQARTHGINFLNGPFVIEIILDEEFPDLKEYKDEMGMPMMAERTDVCHTTFTVDK